MWNSSHTPTVDAKIYDAWANGYVPVNQAFAQAVVGEARNDHHSPLVMLHDYHLYLAAGYIREQLPDAVLQHFTHIPWPGPNYWHLLPSSIRQAIFESLCANDIVGLQTLRDVRNFLLTCQSFLDEAEVDYQRQTVWWNGHLTRVNYYPISIDVLGIKRLAYSPRVRQLEEKLKPFCGEKTIVRVDRAEPSKNIVRGFRAFDMFLTRYPQFLGRVKFLAFLVPSRTHLKQYQRYNQEINDLVQTINAKYGREDWQPIKVFFEHNYPQAIAGMRLYDALMVNSVIDGMNLVAKEGPIVNTRHGVLILSEGAGAHEQLGENALSVAPSDLESTTEALYKALTMPKEERERRAEALKSSVEREDLTMWLCRQFEDLRRLACQLRLLAI
jgi:trehalose 6-phosphate synthase